MLPLINYFHSDSKFKQCDSLASNLKYQLGEKINRIKNVVNEGIKRFN